MSTMQWFANFYVSISPLLGTTSRSSRPPMPRSTGHCSLLVSFRWPAMPRQCHWCPENPECLASSSPTSWRRSWSSTARRRSPSDISRPASAPSSVASSRSPESSTNWSTPRPRSSSRRSTWERWRETCVRTQSCYFCAVRCQTNIFSPCNRKLTSKEIRNLATVSSFPSQVTIHPFPFFTLQSSCGPSCLHRWMAALKKKLLKVILSCELCKIVFDHSTVFFRCIRLNKDWLIISEILRLYWHLTGFDRRLVKFNLRRNASLTVTSWL